jgi:hypothetical protein
MAQMVRGTVYKRCGCRDSATGKRKVPTCDQLPRHGHGSWYLSLEMPVGMAGERRRPRLGGHRSRHQAELALRRLQTHHVRPRVRRGGPLGAGCGTGWLIACRCVPPIRFHDLRHGAATLAQPELPDPPLPGPAGTARVLAVGADLKAIQDMPATPASCSPPTPTPVCCPKSHARPRRASPPW